MIKHKDHFHGSDLEKIESIYGIKKEDIVSFSANVNPLGVSPLLRASLSEKIDAITTYPDREYTSLRKCIAEYCHTDYENIIVGNGSTELISLFIQIEHPKKALVIGPTYSEYEREIALGGGTTLYYPLKEKDDFTLDVEDFVAQLNESIDLLFSLFAPYAGEEFQRVLKPDGMMILGIPGENHLIELKNVIYEKPYKNQVKDYDLAGFSFQKAEKIETKIHLQNKDDILNLFQMTPYYYRTRQEDLEKIHALCEFDVTISFELLVYKKQ